MSKKSEQQLQGKCDAAESEIRTLRLRVGELEKQSAAQRKDLKGASEHLEKLNQENERLDKESTLFRQFYMKNTANAEVYGKNEPEYVRHELATTFRDFNKAVSNKGSFIKHELGELEQTLNQGLLVNPKSLQAVTAMAAFTKKTPSSHCA